MVCNVDAAEVASAEASRAALVRQVTGTVRWEPSVRLLIEKGASLFIEVGPGKVLWGLMRQIDRSKTCLTVGDEEAILRQPGAGGSRECRIQQSATRRTSMHQHQHLITAIRDVEHDSLVRSDLKGGGYRGHASNFRQFSVARDDLGVTRLPL